jgi:hypothetical protein
MAHILVLRDLAGTALLSEAQLGNPLEPGANKESVVDGK